MLSYLFGLIQAFERDHGRLPLLVCLNLRHLQQLLSECPYLANTDQVMPLGFRISVQSEESLPHPRVMLLPSIMPLNPVAVQSGIQARSTPSLGRTFGEDVSPTRAAAPARSATPRKDNVHPALRTPA